MGQALFFKAFFPLTAFFLGGIDYLKILSGEKGADANEDNEKGNNSDAGGGCRNSSD
jgi:hypothetical protein